MELGHSQIQIVNSFACLYSIYRHVNVQCILAADILAVYNLWPLCAFLWCCLPLTIGGHIPGLAISDVGANTGSEGLKCWDCSQRTTRLFSAFSNSPSFLWAKLRPTDCVCICQHVHRGTDIILNRACVRMWSAHYGFTAPALANLLDVNTERGTLPF